MLKNIIGFIIIFNIFNPVCVKGFDIQINANSIDNVRRAFSVLDIFYSNGTGFYNIIEDWHNANILEQTANWIDILNGLDLDYVSEYENRFGNFSWKNEEIAFRKRIVEGMYYGQTVNGTCYGNMYNDDILWFVLAWYRVYEVLGDARFLVRSRSLYQCVTGSWDNVCDGGLYWNHWNTYKNAITNSLFIMASKKLGETDWLDKGLVWWLQSGMLSNEKDEYLVNDGLNRVCQNNGGTVWTYNMGLSLGFLGDIMGNKVFNSSVEYFDMNLLDDGIFTELCEIGSKKCSPPCNGGCDGDQEQFKGIFMRYLGYYGTGYMNAKVVVGKNLDGMMKGYGINGLKNGYGVSWRGKIGLKNVTYVTQSSAIDLLLSWITFDDV